MNPHPQIVSTGKCVASLCAVAVLLGILLLPNKGAAQNITLQDGGSTAIINPGNGSGNLGMNSWSVGGVTQSQLNQQWFWYANNYGVTQPLNMLGTLSVINNAYGTEGLNDVTLTYDNGSGLVANVEYVLSGNVATSGSGYLTEFIWIDNNSGSTKHISFYQYSNFNLLQNNVNNVNISSDGFGGYNGATQTTGGPGGTGIAEVIDAPSANFAEANYADGSVNSTLYKLNNTANLTLNNTLSAGPGDVTWAFQWWENIADGGEFNITKDKGLSVKLVPEPSMLALIALGMGALGLTLRRKSA